MIIGDKLTDDNGIGWTITAITEQGGATAIESMGNPPKPEIFYAPTPTSDIATIEAVVEGLITTLIDKGVLY